MDLLIKHVRNFDFLNDLKYQTPSSAGFDLFAAIDYGILLAPMQTVIVPSGIAIELAIGYEAQVRPRSGLAFKHGITILNSPGTIDSDYRGEISLLLINLGKENFNILPGMRIAQIIISKYEKVNIKITEYISSTERGIKGFGSTGI